ncbi:MAG: ShlB/FhaC/HecB family hemolysin secretion/activation protein [Cyanobacteria bacterium J06621_8]
MQFANSHQLFLKLLNQFLGRFTQPCTVGFLVYCHLLTAASSAAAAPQNSTPESKSLNSNNAVQVPDEILLHQFEVIGNEVIPPSEIDELLQPYLFRPIEFVELIELQQRITKLFVKRGYFNSGAYIPPQTIKNNTLRVEIIQGRIEDIKIYGLEELHPDYVLKRLNRFLKPPVNEKSLLKALQLLQLNPLIANITAEVSQGLKPGQSYLQITVEEADNFYAELTIDNYRTPSIGAGSRQLEVSDQNLLGFGDRFNVKYINTDGSNSLSNLGYKIPLGADNSTLEARLSVNNSRIITDVFADLNLTSRNRYFDLTYRQPLWESPSNDFTLGLSASYQTTQLSLMDIGFPTLARGSDEEGITTVSALRFAQEYRDRGTDHAFVVSSQFNIGLDILDATSNPDPLPDGSFFLWRGQLQYLKRFAPRNNFLIRSKIQLADRPLVSLEQFAAGGPLNVRGYTQDGISADNGVFFSIEFNNAVWQNSAENVKFEVIPFFDVAKVWNNDDFPVEANDLISVGLGLQFTIQDILVSRIDWGVPFLETPDFPENSLQESGFYFSLKFRPL